MAQSYDLLKQKLRKVFNLKSFVNHQQKDAVKTILKREQDVIISMPSGCRKSLCYQLPAILENGKITIVCSASSASIKGHIHHLKKYKLSAVSISSTLTDEEQERIASDALSEQPAAQFIYVTPAESSTESFNKILRSLNENGKLAYFAVHDAHYVSQRAQDFHQEYLKFGALRTDYPAIPWIALTHSASADVLADIAGSLHLRIPIATFQRSSFRKNLFHDIFFKNTLIDPFMHLAKCVINFLDCGDDDDTGNNKKKPCGIVYCKNRDTVDLVNQKLTEAGISTKAIHGGMRTKDRKKIQEDWTTGSVPVIVATTSFVASVDKSSIRFVLHWDVPRSVVNYYKESGMAGRDGKLSHSRIYYCKTDVQTIDAAMKSDIEKSKNARDSRKTLRAHADFLKMTSLCETIVCRHKIFSEYFDELAPQCKDRCDVCSNSQEVRIALDLFHRLPGTSSSDREFIERKPLNFITTTPMRSNSPARTVIKEEVPHSIDNLFGIETRPTESVSPARTVVKDEFDNSRCASPAETLINEKPIRNTASNGHVTPFSDELCGMQTHRQRNVSPARTVIKEELNEMHHNFDCNVSASGVDSKDRINLFTSPRCTSPAETVIEAKYVVTTPTSGTVSPVTNTPSSTRSGQHTPQYLQAIVIKNEPKTPERPADNSESIVNGKSATISHRFPSHNATEMNKVFPAESVNLIGPCGHIDRNDSDSANDTATGISSSITVIKPKVSTEMAATGSVSPTGTIIKGECLSPDKIDDLENDFLYSSVADNIPKTVQSLKINQNCGQVSSETIILHNVPKPNQKRGSDAKTDIQSTDGERVSSESGGGIRRRSRSRSPHTRRSRDGTFDRGESRSRSHERFKSYTKVRERSRSRSSQRICSRSDSRNRSKSRSRSNDRFERKRKVRERSRNKSPYRRRSRSGSGSIRRSHGSSFSRRISRSRSNEKFERGRKVRQRSRSRSPYHRRSRSGSRSMRMKGERLELKRRSRSKSYERKPLSPYRKMSYKSERSRERRRRYSSESETDASFDANSNDRPSTSSGRYRSSQQPSTSAKSIRNPGWSNVRFSVSPDITEQENELPDYGWEDPAPPKLEEKPEPQLDDLDVIVKEKMEEFHRRNDSTYDLNSIEESKNELFRAIEESVALKAQRKLTALDKQIEEKKNDYCLQLFGTDNFDNWDDDPALSNVETTSKLKAFKSLVPDNILLFEKMSCKHVINAMKIAPVRNGNELVFQGHIKEIENEFQGQEIPQHLIDSLKQEKTIIADLVTKHLMPYYKSGRIQPKELFSPTARKISHIFYERFSDEKTINRYIDNLFIKVGKITVSTDIVPL